MQNQQHCSLIMHQCALLHNQYNLLMHLQQDQEQSTANAVASGTGELILVAEDEPLVQALVEKMLGFGWLIVLGVFMVVSFIADRLARSETSRGVQYAGLGLFIIAEAFIFLPLLYKWFWCSL